MAGLVYSSLYVESGWLGQFLVPLGIEAAYSRLAIVLVLVFISLPFVVRTVQPVLESLDSETEEAAALLGANRWQTFRRVLLPAILPGWSPASHWPLPGPLANTVRSFLCRPTSRLIPKSLPC